MTNNQSAPVVQEHERQDAEEQQSPETPWERAITRVATQLASPHVTPQDLAILAHRFAPEKLSGDSGIFWRVLVQSGAPVEITDPEGLRRWATLISAVAHIAESTPSRPGNWRTSAHNPNRPLGRALFLGDQQWRREPVYPEISFQNLLSSTGPPLRRHAHHALTCVADHQGTCDLREIAALLHADLTRSRPDLDAARLAIALPYYSMLRQQS